MVRQLPDYALSPVEVSQAKGFRASRANLIAFCGRPNHVNAHAVRCARDAGRHSGDDDHSLAYAGSADFEKRAINLNDHVVGVSHVRNQEGFNPPYEGQLTAHPRIWGEGQERCS